MRTVRRASGTNEPLCAFRCDNEGVFCEPQANDGCPGGPGFRIRHVARNGVRSPSCVSRPVIIGVAAAGDGAVGTIVGGGGALIGHELGGGTAGTIAGGAGGALLGRHLDKQNTRSRSGC